MYNFKQYLEEGRDAPLFHGTGNRAADLILKENVMKPLTIQMISGKSVAGTSLSRSFKFAEYFGGGITFELDQRKLTQRNKIVPFSYWNSDKQARGMGADNPNNEYEEFVIGEIKFIHRCIIKIHMNQYNEAELNRNKNIELYYTTLFSHPLLWSTKNKRFINQ